MTRPSPTPSSSSISSVIPPPQIIERKKKKAGTKEKKTSEGQAEHGKNEGVDLNWAYAPPPGAVLVEKDDVNGGEFDWDKINNDEDLELWLIRVPEGVKPKYLENLKVDIASSSTSACIGTIKRKHTTFDIWSIGEDEEGLLVGGDELKNLTCLLPRASKKGKLYPTPKPIAHRIVIAAQAVSPTPVPSSESSSLFKNPPRHSYPKEILKHRFKPYGSHLTNAGDVTAMEVDDVEEEAQPPASPKKKRTKRSDVSIADEETTIAVEPEAEVKKVKGKKRKGEPGDAPDTPTKKAKKAKVA